MCTEDHHLESSSNTIGALHPEWRWRGGRKLVEADYVAIYLSKKPCCDLMQEFGIAQNTVYAVWNRRLGKWATKHLEDRKSRT